MDGPGPSSAYYASFAETAHGPIRPTSPPSSPILAPRRTPSDDLANMQSESLYAILNLERDASESEIREHYRSLATTFHPDRQQDAAAKLAAHGRFQAIQRAYEILMDSQKRTVYDLFGEEGLRTNWDVGPRNKSPEELRRHFQKRAYEKRQLDAEALVKSKGNMQVHIDARAVFFDPSMFARPERIKHDPISRLKRIRTGRVSMKHSFEMPVAERTQLVWTGHMMTKGGRGGANVEGTIKHQFSPRLWAQFGCSLLAPRVFTGKATYTYDENTFVTIDGVQQTMAAPPRMSVTLGRRLYAYTTGFITYKTGFYSLGPWGESLPLQLFLADQSALSVGATTAPPDASGWTVQTQAGLNESNVSADWSIRLFGLNFKVGAQAGLEEGITGFLESEGRITENTRGGLSLQAAWAGAITLRVQFARLGQRVSLPIMLSHDLNPYVLFGAIAIPAATYATAYRFYIEPRKRKAVAERIAELREEHADYIAQQKVEAQEAVSVMERPTASKTAAEREKRGLIVISAQYGKAELFTDRGIRSPDGDEEAVIDVTLPVQALVSNSKLVIPGGRGKFNILGFWDPCIGENKKLRVRYLFRDALHEVTVDDAASLRIPTKAHALEG